MKAIWRCRLSSIPPYGGSARRARRARFQEMLSWLGRLMISRNMARSREGDLEPALRMDAEDIRFKFPGDSSWGAELTSKAELRGWLERFAEAGVQLYPDEVVLQG